MLDQRRRCWPDVVQMLYKCIVFAGHGLENLADNFHSLKFFDIENKALQ